MPPRLIAWLFFCIVGCCFWTGSAWADRRAALVIGNSAYKNVPKLTNPANDAASIAGLFRDAKFEVIEARQDLGNVEMRRVLREFSDKAKDADVAVVYYAGHGVEVEGVNYLIPTDALLERDSDAYDEAISLDRVLQAIEPARRLRLVILDACRDNPFARTMKRTVASRSLGRGLAGVEPGKPNTLIAFAAKGGSTADDGNGEHSPFTVALLKHLTTPGLDLRKAFGLIRDDVMNATGNRQEPFVYGSLGGTDVSLVPVLTPAVQATQPQANPQAEVRKDYELALQIGTVEVWNSFLKQYPSGFYADLAKAQLGRATAEAARLAAADKARAAEDEKSRLAADKASAAAQAKASAEAKAAEDARLAAEKAKQQEATRAAAAEQARAAAERAAADKAAKEQAEADAKAIREKAQAEARAIRDKAEADAKAAEQARKAAEQEAERLRVAAVEQAKPAQPTDKPATLAPDRPAQVASLPPADAAGGSPQDLARSLQTELRRVGCFSGKVDGDWQATSQRSLDQFNKFAGMKLDVKLASLDAIDAVKAKAGRICPLLCQHGFRADGEACVKITCKSGYQIGDDNTCEKIETKKPKEKPTVAAKPAGGAEKPTQAPSGCANVPSGSYLAEQMGCQGKPSAANIARQAEGIGNPKSATAPSNGQQIVCNGAEPCRPLRKGCRIERNAAAANTVAREVCD